MHVLVTGASGFIGRALVAALTADGHRVTRLVRRETDEPDTATWDPVAGRIDARALDGCDAVVHLAGEGIGDRRWTVAQKHRILESRTRGTSLLAEAIASAPAKPEVLVSASAIGFYGDRGDEVCTETSSAGPPDDFVVDVVRRWEAAASAASDAGVRVVHPRSGIVLSPRGGVLRRMLPPFRLGLGGRQGSGAQYMSWITLDDEVAALRFLLEHDDLEGPVNLTAPNPVTNAEMTRVLGRVLGRPTFLPTPMPFLSLVYGAELVRTLLVAGQRVVPARLEAARFHFAHPTLEDALRHLLDRPAAT